MAGGAREGGGLGRIHMSDGMNSKPSGDGSYYWSSYYSICYYSYLCEISSAKCQSKSMVTFTSIFKFIKKRKIFG